jgi:hypothetical protein
VLLTLSVETHAVLAQRAPTGAGLAVVGLDVVAFGAASVVVVDGLADPNRVPWSCPWHMLGSSSPQAELGGLVISFDLFVQADEF